MHGALVTSGLTVAQVAARSGVRPDTIRYYERIGLLPAPARTSGDHRRYDTAGTDLESVLVGLVVAAPVLAVPSACPTSESFRKSWRQSQYNGR